MKKALFVIGLALLCGASIISCKKDCYCDTTYVNADGTDGTIIRNFNVGPEKKKECEALSRDTIYLYNGTEKLPKRIVCHH